MKLDEAVRLWVNRDFSNIPGALVERAFKESPEELELLAGGTRQSDCCDAEVRDSDGAHYCEECDEECETHWSGAEYAWPAAWGTMFAPNDRVDEDWIRENADQVADLGFIVYESDETGVILGVDGAGFDFYDALWTPLYKARGLQWHETEGPSRAGAGA